MTNIAKRIELLPLIVLVLLLLVAIAARLFFQPSIGIYGSEHIHANFLVVINNQTINFSAPMYQSTNTSVRNPLVHLHDGNGHILHTHATGITWGYALQTLGAKLNNTCLTWQNEPYCTNSTHILYTSINGRMPFDLASREVHDLDRALIMVIPRSEERNINKAMMAVPDDACIPSGRCPERGLPEHESGCSANGDCLAPEHE